MHPFCDDREVAVQLMSVVSSHKYNDCRTALLVKNAWIEVISPSSQLSLDNPLKDYLRGFLNNFVIGSENRKETHLLLTGSLLHGHECHETVLVLFSIVCKNTDEYQSTILTLVCIQLCYCQIILEIQM